MALTWRKVWWFIWEDDSIWSWLVNVVLAFVLIKFIVYPGLGFLLSTTHPIVAVVSSSMEHDGSFDTWFNSQALCEYGSCTQEEYYSQYSITRTNFLNFDYKNGFNTGDIMILRGVSPNNIQVGDVIVFKSKRPDPIIHRIIAINKENENIFYHTKGDHNIKSIQDVSLDETTIPVENTIGFDKYQKVSKAAFRIPYLGYVKIVFVKLITFIRTLIA